MKTYYHFTSDKLRDGRPIPPIGEWLEHEGPVIPCKSGLHASEHPADAIEFAPGCMLHLVELDEKIIRHGGDKVVTSRRKILATIDATGLLRDYARWCALRVIDKWDAPEVVKRYLETGDDTLRSEAAWAAWTARAAWTEAAWAAARAARTAAADAPWTAACSSAAAARAAWTAAAEEPWTPACSSAAARAARTAATRAARKARAATEREEKQEQRNRLLELVNKAFGI